MEGHPARRHEAHRASRFRLIAVSGLLALVAGIAVEGASAHAAPVFAPPNPALTFGKASHAFVYPFGMAWDPTTPGGGSLMVDDYTNYNIKRFSPAGAWTNTYGNKQVIQEQPSGIAVNPTNGDYVVAFAFDGFGYKQFDKNGVLECTANIGQQ